MTWQQPPQTIYTQAQHLARSEEVDRQLAERTTLRSQDDVEQAVAKLQHILNSYERQDLLVTLVWFIEKNGLVSHHVFHSLKEMTEELDYSPIHPYTLILTKSGLSLAKKYREDLQVPEGATVAQYEPGFIWVYEEVTELDHVNIVRNYQLMASQLDFLLKALRMDHRGRAPAYPPNCGCGGDIGPFIGCTRYYQSLDYADEVAIHEATWTFGMSFAAGVLDTPEQVAMSIHLQANGFTPTDVTDVLLYKP